MGPERAIAWRKPTAAPARWNHGSATAETSRDCREDTRRSCPGGGFHCPQTWPTTGRAGEKSQGGSSAVPCGGRGREQPDARWGHGGAAARPSPVRALHKRGGSRAGQPHFGVCGLAPVLNTTHSGVQNSLNHWEKKPKALCRHQQAKIRGVRQGKVQLSSSSSVTLRAHFLRNGAHIIALK